MHVCVSGGLNPFDRLTPALFFASNGATKNKLSPLLVTICAVPWHRPSCLVDIGVRLVFTRVVYVGSESREKLLVSNKVTRGE